MTSKIYIPWVEKYRPTDFQNIVLNSENKTIFEKDRKTQSLIHKAQERINYKTIKSRLNLPATANSAVDGYGILHQTFLSNPETEFEIAGIAKAGHPYKKKIL